MPQGTVTYPGIVAPKSAVYTQTLGVHPSVCVIKMLPQVTKVAPGGTITFSYDGSSLTLPDCQLDSAGLTINEGGYITSCILQDRRWKWAYAPPIDGYYSYKTLRQLLKILLEQCGELLSDLTAVDDTFMPLVDWQYTEPIVALQQLCDEYGYAVSLGFDSEDVKIVKLGTGETLPISNLMATSESQDPPTLPKYIRVAFGHSVMQARLKLQAVALDTDGIFDPLDDVSYKPAAGWESEPPESLPTVLTEHGAEKHFLAKETVYRVYRIIGFTQPGEDEPQATLDLPDGSGTLNAISQIFPVQDRLLELATDEDGVERRASARVYGIFLTDSETDNQPNELVNSERKDRVYRNFRLDGRRGLVIFPRPIYRVDEEEVLPAELYLEASFETQGNITNQYVSHIEDILFSANGFGFATVRLLDSRLETIIEYNDDHIPTTKTDNEPDLEDLADKHAAALAGRYTYEVASQGWYNKPMFTIRCDGAIRQVKHIITDADDNAPAPGCITIASRNCEFDRYLRSYADFGLRLNSCKRHYDRRSRHGRHAQDWRGEI